MNSRKLLSNNFDTFVNDSFIDSGCGPVGRAVASGVRGSNPGIEIFIEHVLLSAVDW